MDLDTALHTALVDDDIKKHCHVNLNEDGDRFVGIKADSDNAMVYFPIGYQLPETDNEIRTDIKHLIQVLSEFTTSEDRLLAINKFAAPQSVDFPINAYKSVIEYYFSIPEHLPNGSSINKQITYGEYLEKYKGIDTNSLFNAFIMPYNMEQNYFELTSVVGNIGEAVGDWRHNKKFYERIQGIVMDTRYLMYHYTGNPMKEKVALADCIEAVLGKGEVPPVGGAPKHTPVSYMDMSPKQSVSMVAESLNYNIGQEKK